MPSIKAAENTVDSEPLLRKNEGHYYDLNDFRRIALATPAKPEPSRIKLEGSGVGAAPTLTPVNKAVESVAWFTSKNIYSVLLVATKE
jgi:hypothetical protein